MVTLYGLSYPPPGTQERDTRDREFLAPMFAPALGEAARSLVLFRTAATNVRLRGLALKVNLPGAREFLRACRAAASTEPVHSALSPCGHLPVVGLGLAGWTRLP